MDGTAHFRYGYGSHAGGTHQVILGRIAAGQDVLDVGCNRGYLGEQLSRRGCRVWGIDRDADALAHLDPSSYVATTELDLDSATSLPWPGQTYDVVIAADVLEHLVDPLRVLRLLVERLRRSGRIYVSLPNVAHASIRVGLLMGRFRYQEAGILDRTHLHLYTYASAVELVEQAGLRIREEMAGSDRLGTLLNGRLRSRPLHSLLAYNIVIEAERSAVDRTIVSQ